MRKEELFAAVDDLSQAMIKDIQTLLRVDSTRGEAQPSMPYGPGPYKALMTALDMCQREGLTIKNVDGHMGYGQYGQGDHYIGIVGHLDVVEAGEGWIDPPFSGTIKDGRIYSRGALDNKGPLVSAFYGLLALKKLGYQPPVPMRIIFGCNEETGMNDIRYYLDHEPAPLCGFTPDNKFPAIYGERGRALIKLVGDKKKIVTFCNDYLLNANKDGDRLGINVFDEDFGTLIIRNIWLTDDDPLGVQFTLSYPKVDIHHLVDIIQQKAGDLTVTLVSNVDPVLKDKNSLLVQTLNRAYNEVMGQNLRPTTTTGGTYAHHCESIIPFGPSFPNQKGIAHQPNEWVNIDDLIQCAKIYSYGLYQLCEGLK